MQSHARLLARLLVASSPLTISCNNTPGSSPSGTAGGAHAPLGRRAIAVPKPPLTPSGPVPVASASSLAPADGDRPLPACGDEYRSWPEGRTGGPYAMARCYAPPAGEACLAAAAPPLRRVLRAAGVACVYDGPHEQKDPQSGGAWCCYNVGAMGEGRPLLVSDERRSARLVAGRASWG